VITIGYQGIKGGNSEEAAKQLVEKQQLKDVTLIPLVSSFNVLQNVMLGNIDYGVIAMKNNTGGVVKESVQSLQYMDVVFVDEITLPIYHFLFVKDNAVKKEDITCIASHSQALVQCQKTLQSQYEGISLVEDEDTATAAIKLHLDLFPRTTAVLCRENAGYDNQLFLLDAHLEDRNDNTTDFHMFTAKK